jgi:hypothetical protein
MVDGEVGRVPPGEAKPLAKAATEGEERPQSEEWDRPGDWRPLGWFARRFSRRFTWRLAGRFTGWFTRWFARRFTRRGARRLTRRLVVGRVGGAIPDAGDTTAVVAVARGQGDESQRQVLIGVPLACAICPDRALSDGSPGLRCADAADERALDGSAVGAPGRWAARCGCEAWVRDRRVVGNVCSCGQGGHQEDRGEEEAFHGGPRVKRGPGTSRSLYSARAGGMEAVTSWLGTRSQRRSDRRW